MDAVRLLKTLGSKLQKLHIKELFKNTGDLIGNKITDKITSVDKTKESKKDLYITRKMLKIINNLG